MGINTYKKNTITLHSLHTQKTKIEKQCLKFVKTEVAVKNANFLL
jgi:hypothetical protein